MESAVVYVSAGIAAFFILKFAYWMAILWWKGKDAHDIKTVMSMIYLFPIGGNAYVIWRCIAEWDVPFAVSVLVVCVAAFIGVRIYRYYDYRQKYLGHRHRRKHGRSRRWI